MKILVTGGAGYIGSVLVPTLLSEGYKVTVLDNFMYGRVSLMDCFSYPDRFDVTRGDVRDESLVKKLIARVDVIIPLACIVGMPACKMNPLAAKSINLDAILTLLKLVSRDQRIIFPNTNSGYGNGQGEIYCDENTPLRPISLYSQLKVEAEKAILDSGNAITLRLATVFGASPRMRIDLLVNDFVYRAIKDGYIELSESHFKRNYIHVRDVAKAFYHCLRNFVTMKDQTYNVGLSDANLSKKELCDEIRKQIPQFRVYENECRKDPDQRNYIVSNDKIERSGFKPRVTLEEGIRELIKAFQILPSAQFTNLN